MRPNSPHTRWTTYHSPRQRKRIVKPYSTVTPSRRPQSPACRRPPTVALNVAARDLPACCDRARCKTRQAVALAHRLPARRDQAQGPRGLVVLGATGTCKSRLAIDLTLRFGSKVINSDKMQLYKACFSPSVSPHWIVSSSISFFPSRSFSVDQQTGTSSRSSSV
jgi:hypothetical protein